MKLKLVLVRLFVLLLLQIFTSGLFAQSDTIPQFATSVNVDLVSRYIWRGQEYGKAPSIQPGLSATWNDFTLGAWGAYTLTGTGTQETDFYLSKSFGPITFALWDYWSFSDTASMDFLDYHQKTTSHLLEAQVLISGGEKLPFNIMASYFFHGADTTRSMYLELQYVHSAGSLDMLFFAGFQPKGEYYGTNATFVNLGCTAIKTIKVTDHWSLPLSLSLIANPSAKSAYLVAGISL